MHDDAVRIGAFRKAANKVRFRSFALFNFDLAFLKLLCADGPAWGIAKAE